MQARGILSTTALVALVAANAAAGAPAKKVTLTVVVTGGGNVRSRPAGIDCKPACKLHAKRGSRVALTATAHEGAEFSHWSAPCGTSHRCTVKMTAARSVRAYFKATPPPPPPPPPPTPTPKAGRYTGTYTDGTFFYFDLSGTSITNVNFDFNGECSNGGTSYDGGTYLTGPFTVGADGSFSGTATVTYNNGTGSFAVTGTVTTSGSASGTLHATIDLTNGPECTSTGTWTAQVAS